MSKNMFLFSGQGSQYVGMAKELCERYPAADRVFELANDVLGTDIRKTAFEGPEEDLNRTVNSQPAIMACSLAAFEAAKAEGIEFAGAAGHSLGEYAAMAASGMLGYEDAFRLIKIRAEAMDKCARSSEGVMYAIIGPAPEEIETACKQTDGYVVPVNYNSPVQTVIAGEAKAAEAAAELIKQTSTAKRVKAVKLNVASAFHSEIMRPAAEEFLAKAQGFVFSEPKVTFYSNVTGAVLDFAGTDMIKRLADHIVSPVRFTAELAAAQAAGFDTFIELGPNKVLTGLVKKTLTEASAYNIENSATLDAALEALKEG
jgi:[acyl-carrier-protein] S-malonyltransferase